MSYFDSGLGVTPKYFFCHALFRRNFIYHHRNFTTLYNSIYYYCVLMLKNKVRSDNITTIYHQPGFLRDKINLRVWFLIFLFWIQIYFGRMDRIVFTLSLYFHFCSLFFMLSVIADINQFAKKQNCLPQSSTGAE